jgi:hypothetical protein
VSLTVRQTEGIKRHLLQSVFTSLGKLTVSKPHPHPYVPPVCITLHCQTFILSWKLQGNNLQIALSGERANCELVCWGVLVCCLQDLQVCCVKVFRCADCRIYSCGVLGCAGVLSPGSTVDVLGVLVCWLQYLQLMCWGCWCAACRIYSCGVLGCAGVLSAGSTVHVLGCAGVLSAGSTAVMC